MKNKIISSLLCIPMCAGFAVFMLGCSISQETDDRQDKIDAATEVATSYADLVLHKKTSESKAFSQESQDSDALGNIFEKMPYEQGQIVDCVLECSSFEVTDVKLHNADNYVSASLVITMPDLAGLIDEAGDDGYTQDSFVEAIPNASTTKKSVEMKMNYVDDKFLVSTETVSKMGEFIIFIGNGDKYSFSILTDKSALDSVQYFITYCANDNLDAAMEMTLGDKIWDPEAVSNEYIRKFYKQYYSMFDCTFEVSDRDNDTIYVTVRGYGPDIEGACEKFMEEENLINYYADYVYDLYHGKEQYVDSMAGKGLLVSLTKFIEELPPVEVEFVVPVFEYEDQVFPNVFSSIEPNYTRYIHMDQISPEYNYELLLKGLDSLYDQGRVQDHEYEFLKETFEDSWKSRPENNESEYMTPYEGYNYKSSYCDIKDDGIDVVVFLNEAHVSGSRFTYVVKFNGEIIKDDGVYELPYMNDDFMHAKLEIGGKPEPGNYRFTIYDSDGRTVCISTVSVGKK